MQIMGHKEALQARKCRAAILHTLVCGIPFLWGPSSAEYAEHA